MLPVMARRSRSDGGAKQRATLVRSSRSTLSACPPGTAQKRSSALPQILDSQTDRHLGLGRLLDLLELNKDRTSLSKSFANAKQR